MLFRGCRASKATENICALAMYFINADTNKDIEMCVCVRACVRACVCVCVFLCNLGNLCDEEPERCIHFLLTL